MRFPCSYGPTPNNATLFDKYVTSALEKAKIHPITLITPELEKTKVHLARAALAPYRRDRSVAVRNSQVGLIDLDQAFEALPVWARTMAQRKRCSMVQAV